MAEVHFRGTVTNEPALTFAARTGNAQLKLRVAENHSYYDKDRNEWVQTGTTWRDITFWGKKAEDLDGAYHKNDHVAVSGKEESREWTTKEGEKRTSISMRDPLVGIIPKPQQGGAPQANQQQGGFNNSPGYGNQGSYNQQGNGYQQPPANAGWQNPNPGGWDAPDEEPPF